MWCALAITTDMKLIIAFFAVLVTLGFGACSTDKQPTKVAIFTPCCMTGQPEKTVLHQDSWEPGGTVVRLVH